MSSHACVSMCICVYASMRRCVCVCLLSCMNVPVCACMRVCALACALTQECVMGGCKWGLAQMRGASTRYEDCFYEAGNNKHIA